MTPFSKNKNSREHIVDFFFCSPYVLHYFKEAMNKKISHSLPYGFAYDADFFFELLKIPSIFLLYYPLPSDLYASLPPFTSYSSSSPLFFMWYLKAHNG